jgi:AcrR family transcriptional regulator
MASGRAPRAGETRAAILAAAERLFAERGLYAVSNRLVSEVAGQGNNAAVGYHFGTKTDLIRAVLHEHAVPMEDIRARLLRACAGRDRLRDWVVCLVRPVTDHLADLGTPSWYARFAAQLMTDPVLRGIMVDDAFAAPTVRAVRAGLDRCLPHLSPEVRAERHEMVRLLVVHTCAERERALADAGLRDPAWGAVTAGLVDAIVGLLRARATRAAPTRVPS